MRKLILFPLSGLALFAAPAMAGYSPAGYVKNISIDPDGVVTFESSAGHAAPPTCQNSATPNRWSFSSNGDVGQARLAMVLTSYSTHGAISVGGASGCAERPDIEAVYSLSTVDS